MFYLSQIIIGENEAQAVSVSCFCPYITFITMIILQNLFYCKHMRFCDGEICLPFFHGCKIIDIE